MRDRFDCITNTELHPSIAKLFRGIRRLEKSQQCSFYCNRSPFNQTHAFSLRIYVLIAITKLADYIYSHILTSGFNRSHLTLCCFSHMSTKSPCCTGLVQPKGPVCTGHTWAHCDNEKIKLCHEKWPILSKNDVYICVQHPQN